MSLGVRRIQTVEDFESLSSAWAELQARSGQTSPFLSHDWFSCCWGAVAPERSPEILVVEDGGGPVGIAPLMRWRDRRHGLPVRCLGFLECPDTPFADILVSGEAGPVVRALLDHLNASSDWDVVHFQKLPVASPTMKALETALAGCLPWRRAGTVQSPYLAIDGTWDAFYGAKSQRFKKTCRNIQNRLERAGRLSIEEHRAIDPGGAVFADLIDLTRRSWKADRGLAIATMPKMHAFFAGLSRRASARQWLSLWFLRVDGRAVAMEYQLRADGKVHALRADYDVAYREVSPGSALNFAIARSLFERGGVHEYDMGPGLNDYKLRWATGTHEMANVQVYRPRGAGRALHALETAVIPTVRRVRGWFARRPQ